MKQFGFIGAGNMGLPLLKGAISLCGVENCMFYTPVPAEVEKVNAITGAESVENNIQLANNCKFIVLCVKPQFLGSVYEDLKQVDLKDKVVVSIAAGVASDTIRENIGASTKIVRIMPNTPAGVGEGMACICFPAESNLSDEEKNTVLALFNKVGKAEVIPETLMNAAVCANGSSPAYVYMFIEALADSVVKYGIPRKTAYTLAAQTVLGSAKMVLETGIHPGELKDNVCSPGGTTIAAVEKLEEYGFRNAIMKATDACYEKSVELGRKKA
ncbi:MAG: pyrroline-5-carboxylate reductase [Lachnospiraceae bacterium]|nr:pyrroline-5-carboxylate reductase [Lachnospiraceae bacterium]